MKTPEEKKCECGEPLEVCENCETTGCPCCDESWNIDEDGLWFCPECSESMKTEHNALCCVCEEFVPEDDVRNVCIDCVEEIQALKDALREATEWISVEDRLPDIGERVLCANIFGTFSVLHLDQGGVWRNAALCEIKLIAHWLPIPGFRKEEIE